MKLKIQLLNPRARVPTYATEGSACFDLYATDSGIVMPGRSRTFGTGLAVEIEPAHVMRVYSRSGHGFKYGIRLANGTGIIDSDYRQELMVCLHNDGDEPFAVSPGDRIAQAMIEPVARATFALAPELSATGRTGGLGSTGA